MKKIIRQKRLIAFFLAIALTLSPIVQQLPGLLGIKFPMIVKAGNIRVVNSSGNLLDGQAFDFYGHDGRTGIWYWKTSDGYPAYCIQPTKAMQGGAGMNLDRYSLEDWPTAELDMEQRELIFYAMAACGASSTNKDTSTANYILIQSAIWAITSGEWTSVEDFRDSMTTITNRVRNNRASISAEIMGKVDEYVEMINTFVGNDSIYIPKFASKHEKDAPKHELSETIIGSGIYEGIFDVNDATKGFKYQIEGNDLPYAGWSYEYMSDNKVKFTYDSHIGTNYTPLIIGIPRDGSGLARMIGIGNIGVLLPDSNSNQEMVLGVEAGTWVCYTRLHASNAPSIPDNEEGSFIIEAHRYEHEESFKSNYKIELNKADAETGWELADTTFSVLEMFDFSQLNRTNLERSQFSQEPSSLTEHVTVTTNENGYASHSDQKSYTYEKTYCYGHPEPIINYIPYLDDDGEDEDEADAIAERNAEIEELNKQLEADAWAAWQAEADSCKADVDFHDEEIGEAEKEMREDRDAAFHYFINLKYAYTVEEIAARNGYILHDYHMDDNLIPVIEMASSQTGGTGGVIGHYYRGEYISGGSGYSFGHEMSEKAAVFSVTGWDGVYEESEVSFINQNNYNKTNVGFIFNLLNHRTEGEIHFNKRDLYLYQEDEDNSYGQSQGDATLEGAVYGLYAAEDIEHPDGKTGIVFSAGELVAIATTDINGDAAFTIITENSETADALTNLYNGGSLFDRDYPDYQTLNGGTWIGRPLLLGSYYIEEIARSEGYELSQHGINLSESNRTGAGQVLAESGSASVGALSHPVNGWDGSWNDFTMKYYRTEAGFDIYVTGYPANSFFYQVDTVYEDVNYKVVADEYEQVLKDEHGNELFLIAEGGEYKYGEDGNLVPVMDEYDNPLYDTSQPLTETVSVTSRLNYYPDREVATGSNAEYQEPVDESFVLSEMEELLAQMKYKTPGSEAPVKRISLTQSGITNEDLIEEILNELLSDTFWDSYAVLSVYEDGIDSDTWHAIVAYDYTALSAISNFYDAASGRVLLKRDVTYAPGSSLSEGYTYIIFDAGDFTKSGSRVTVNGFEVDEVVYGEAYTISPTYAPLYATYEVGEQILDMEGNPIPLTETVYEYGWETVTEEKEILTQLTNVTYDDATGAYIIHIDNEIDWDSVIEYLYMTIRATAPDTEYKGMPYADYILQNGTTINAFSVKPVLDEGSYVKLVNLIYPGQLIDFQDAGTRLEPVIVLQRIIKQALRVIKDISLSSYDQINTYSIHRDPYTVLYGGYGGRLPAKAFPGFSFKSYLVSDLEATGRLEKNEDGSWDYKAFFADKENEEYFENLAVAWDKPEADVDGDLTTIHINTKGNENYYGDSVSLPYGTYVIVEQQPKTIPLKHYQIDDPKEVALPYVPHVDSAGYIHEDIPSREYLYDAEMTAEDMNERYGIRFIEESHTIKVMNKDLALDHEIYKYGLSNCNLPAYKTTYLSYAENAGTRDNVYYQTYVDRMGNIIDYGVTLNNVMTMTGKSTAIDRVYAHALVPWSVLPPVYGGAINDDGDIGNRDTGVEADGSFNWVAFAKTGFENEFFKSWLRFEKIDSETGENIIHAGAKFKIYAAKRDVFGNSEGTAVEGTGNVIFDANGIPVYDEEDLISLYDKTGTEIGVFEAFSTEVEVVKADGTIEKQVVGFIELPQPLGAGVYVLVEIEAPPGYLKSAPIAFEVYSDEVSYYYEGNPEDRRTAVRYSYAIVGTDTEKLVSQIAVEDKPSNVAIHKVEDGEETITFKVFGTKALLEARGDVINITYDPVEKIWWGTVTKAYDKWSEDFVYGTEAELKAMKDVKLLYDKDGNYLGYGIHFDIYVADAQLTLYEGLEVHQLADGYEGVVVYRNEAGKVTEIIATETGTHQEIQKVGKDITPTQNHIWNAVEMENSPVSLLFYDLDKNPHEVDPGSGRTYMLNDRGMRTCMADPVTGMAYVLDDYGRMITYPLNEDAEKIISQSIIIYLDNDGNQYIYNGIETVNDENDLPKYYLNGYITLKDDIWTSGLIEHVIKRLPFGAYALEETRVPYDQGYIQSRHIGFILEETDEEQRFYLENDFTKTEYAKVDIRTKEEIPDAKMALWMAEKINDDSDKGFHLEYARNESGERILIRSWISGYLYDDAGNPISDASGKPITNVKPYWVDHLPVGCYILEEVEVPHHYGYVQSPPLEIIVEETGFVQTFVMEDDFTSIEVVKMDDYKKELLVDAEMGFYKALLDSAGNPVLDAEGIPLPDEKLFGWVTGDGKAIAATAHPKLDPDTSEQIFDKNGEPIIAYNYDIKPINDTLRGQYYFTETGALRMEYLPIGYYVLMEEQPPLGIATADPILIEVREVGHLVEVQYNQMDDQPLTVELFKYNTAEDGITEKVIIGAVLRIYETDEFGVFEKVQARDENNDGLWEVDEADEWLLDDNGERIPVMVYDPLKLRYQFITGKDGVYEAGDDIPEGFIIGDLKPHTIRYIPLGNYVLIEHGTPYGFLTADPVFFTIVDTEDIQIVEMADAIPEGFVEIEKVDEFTSEQLPGAQFILRNKTLDIELETLVTEENGLAISGYYPIGYVESGKFHHYIYTIQEKSAPDDYMLNQYIYQFQFPYEDEETPVVSHKYLAVNEPNQVIISKKLISGEDELPGAYLELYRILTEIIFAEAGEEIGIEEWEELYEDWISTETPHYIVNIPSGRYILRETQAPGEGYAIAEEIYFEIEENMITIPEITMFDDHTKTEIHKVPTGGARLLGGAKFQLKDAEGTILDEFTTVADEPYTINGLAPGIYILTELEAPSGYQKLSKPVTIEVTDTYEAQVFRIENKAAGGGGGGSSPAPYICKVDKDTYAGLGDAWIVIYNPDGSVYAKGQTNSAGRFYFKTPPAGTYSFQELAAPKGYMLNDKLFRFTVDASGNITGDTVLENVKWPEIPIYKVDGIDGCFVSGAVIEFYDTNGYKIFQGTTDDHGSLQFVPSKSGTYTFKEAEAPKGYTLSEATYLLTVNEDGSYLGDGVVINYPTVGKIITLYNRSRDGYGGTESLNGIPRTSDTYLTLIIGLGGLFVSVSVIFIIKRKGKKS